MIDSVKPRVVTSFMSCGFSPAFSTRGPNISKTNSLGKLTPPKFVTDVTWKTAWMKPESNGAGYGTTCEPRPSRPVKRIFPSERRSRIPRALPKPTSNKRFRSREECQWCCREDRNFVRTQVHSGMQIADSGIRRERFVQCRDSVSYTVFDSAVGGSGEVFLAVLDPGEHAGAGVESRWVGINICALGP